jgi:hypothetical protein
MYLCFLNTVSHFVQEVRPIDIRAWRALNPKANLVSNHRAIPRAKSLPHSPPRFPNAVSSPKPKHQISSNIPKNAVYQRQQSKTSNTDSVKEKKRKKKQRHSSSFFSLCFFFFFQKPRF